MHYLIYVETKLRGKKGKMEEEMGLYLKEHTTD